MTDFHKRIVAISLAVVMAFGLVGCSGDPTTPSSSGEPSPTGGASESAITDSTWGSDYSGLGNDTDPSATGDPSSAQPGGTDASGNKVTGTKAPTKNNPGGTTQTASKGPGDQTPGSTTKPKPSDLTGRVTNLNGRTIRVNTMPGVDKTSQSYKLEQEWKRQLEDKYNCKIVDVEQYNETGGSNRIATSVLSGEPLVDIWSQNGLNELFSHYRAGLVQNLSSLKVFDFSEFHENQEVSNFDGQYYAVVPIGGNYAWASLALFVNTKLLKQYGVNDDLFALQKSGKWTWDEFIRICDKFNANVNDPNITAVYDAGMEMYHAMLFTRGVDWVKNNNGTFTFNGNDAKAQEALSQYRDLVQKKTVRLGTTSLIGGAGSTEGFTGSQSGKFSFLNGQAAFSFGGLSCLKWVINMPDSVSQDVKDNLGILLLPKVNAGDKYTMSNSILNQSSWCIPYGVKKPNEVATILNELLHNPLSMSAAEEKNNFFAVNIDPELNRVNGDNSRATVEMIYDEYQAGNAFFNYNAVAGLAEPSIWTGENGWPNQVFSIANGTKAMGSVLSSVTDTYNNALAALHDKR